MNCLSVFVVSLFLFVPAVFAEPGDTITTGTVYAYGHELEPPYVLEIVDSTLRVNGVQVYPDLGQYDREPPPSEEEISEWTKKAILVYRHVWDMEARLEEEGKTGSEITTEVVEYLRGQEDMVDSVTSVHTTGFMVHWKDGSEEVFTTYDRRREKQTKEEQLENEWRAWIRNLARNSIIIAGSGGCFCPRSSAGEVERAIARARAATPQQLEDWKSRVFGSRIARQFNDPWTLEEIR